jgi:hypothetical protein
MSTEIGPRERKVRAFLKALEKLSKKHGFEIHNSHDESWVSIFDANGMLAADFIRLTISEGLYALDIGRTYQSS